MPKSCTHLPLLISLRERASLLSTVILPVVLYGCETWSLKLREERRLGVFQNRVLWRIFGPKGDEITGEWRKLHNEEFMIRSPHSILFG
jgi:hypothetical protein